MAYTFCASGQVCLDGSQIIPDIVPPFPQCCTPESNSTTQATYCSGVDTCGAPANPENNCGVNTPVTCGACTTCSAGTQGHTCTGNPTGSQYYCGGGTCKQCSAGQTWTGSACAAPSCAAGTAGQSCGGLGGSVAGYYCSDNTNGDSVASPGVCCQDGYFWNSVVGTCQVASSCSPLGSISGSNACCAEGPKYGLPSYNQYEPITTY
jgi:hypothetical protein